VSLAAEHYGILMRNVEKNVPVALEMNIENKFYDDDLNSFNVVGEIQGTDKAEEVVMVGAHFDSWHTGTGATDNAAGSAIMMEVMRILKADGLAHAPDSAYRVVDWRRAGTLWLAGLRSRSLCRAQHDGAETRSRQDVGVLQCRQRDRDRFAVSTPKAMMRLVLCSKRGCSPSRISE
jgi:hypothetical protein